MKVIQVLTQLESGGAQRRAIQMAELWREEGLNTETVFLYRKRSVYTNKMGIHWLHDKRMNVMNRIFIIPKLVRKIKNLNGDVLISFTAWANIFASLAAVFCGIKIRVVCQTQPPTKIGILAKYIDLVLGTCGIYTHIVVNSGYTKSCFETYPNRYKKRIVFIENGVFIPKSEKVWPKPADKFVFLSAGRLSKQKNHSLLINAFGSADLPNSSELWIAGEGELKSVLQSQIESKNLGLSVKLIGEVAPEDIGSVYEAADCFVFPSRWETFGLAAVEAASVLTPVVSSDIEVLTEVLTFDGTPCALFFKHDSVSELSEALKSMYYCEKVYNKYRKNSELLKGKYEFSRMSDSFKELVFSGHK